MALESYISVLNVAIPVAKALPLVGTYLEGAFSAMLAICEMIEVCFGLFVR
jgi:hypothetical protein